MAELDSDFEDDLKAALLDEAKHEFVGKRDSLVDQAVRQVHERLRTYGREFGYDVEPVIDSFTGVNVDRSSDSLTVRFGWEHPAIEYFEFGTSDHTIEGDPVLSFVWAADDAPDWAAQEFDRERDGYRVFLPEVEVAGVEETRAIRDAVNWLRREVTR